MNGLNKRQMLATALVLTLTLTFGCDPGTLPDPCALGIPGACNDNDNDNGTIDVDNVELSEFATNTNRATAIALRPSDGALFLINPDGLFGPIVSGDDVSTLTPFGATNLADPELFDTAQNSFVLAITSAGEFWIGSPCCRLMGVVPADGGDAVPFTGLLDGVAGDSVNVQPETLAIVPTGFDGAQMHPGNILVGADTTFSRMGAIDVDARTAMPVDNPLDPPGEVDDTNREGHHMHFGFDGTLYASRALLSGDFAGIQTIATDGTPTDLPGTASVAADTFVALESGDLLLNGSYRGSDNVVKYGIFFWAADSEAIVAGAEIPVGDRAEDDEMIIAPDGTVYMSQPELNRIVRATDNR